MADEDYELSPWLVFEQRLEENFLAILVFDWKLADLLECLRIRKLVQCSSVLSVDSLVVLRWWGCFCRFSLLICSLHGTSKIVAEVDED